MEHLKQMHELCDTISEAIAEANEKIRSGGGRLTAGDVDYVDKLTHALKSVKATIAMMEDEDGASGFYPMSYADGSRDSGMSNRYSRGRSYARGRTNARRDSMGRYSSTYSRDGGMVEELRELMEDAPDEQTRQEFQKFIRKIETM